MNNIYWVGIRESDLITIENLYDGSITYFGSGINKNHSLFNNKISRKNHNEELPLFIEFIEKSMYEVLNENPKAKFMLYNQILAYSLCKNLRDKIICLNDKDILDKVNNKILCRDFLNNSVNILENIKIPGKKINYNYLKDIWTQQNEYVIQSPISSGGTGTYIINEKNQNEIISKLKQNEKYLVTPYYEHAISLNVHCVLNKNSYIIYPVSIQITKKENENILYKGCDFIAAQQLKSEIRDSLLKQTEKICKILSQNNYLGVCGIDFMLINGEIYFSEINPRFQASTAILNLSLSKSKMLSINEATIMAYYGQGNLELKKHKIKDFYSSYVYEQSIQYEKFNKHIFNTYFDIFPEYSILKDGYTYDSFAENNSYLFRTIYPYSITSIVENKLLVNELFSGYLLKKQFNAIELKTMLMIFGIRISSDALLKIKETGNIREANFSAIDIIINEKLIINCPYKINHSEFSPFYICVENNLFYLFYLDKKITQINIYYESSLNNKITSTGIFYNSVAFLATDRLRINYNPVCYFKLVGQDCKFCNLPNCNQHYHFEDIQEILRDFLDNESFRHILIGGGSNLPNSDFNNIIELAKFIKSKTNKPIYLMSLPPKDSEILTTLYNVGINEVAFNIEIFNQELANCYMPGKGKITRDHYYDILKQAVELWGNSGNVKSMVIIGLESEDEILKGIEKLCNIGVQPMLSIFRPMENTALKHLLPPTTEYILKLYRKAYTICKKYKIDLGPSCIFCQNNTLTVPVDYDNFVFTLS